MIGCRLKPTKDGKLPIEHHQFMPGDYCGPLMGYTGEKPAVFFRNPVGWFCHVTSPPHTFRECEDGSLEIRNSILSTRGNGETWHGYLDQGHNWRTA